jgi:hypothetical protein
MDCSAQILVSLFLRAFNISNRFITAILTPA